MAAENVITENIGQIVDRVLAWPESPSRSLVLLAIYERYEKTATQDEVEGWAAAFNKLPNDERENYISRLMRDRAEIRGAVNKEAAA